MTRKPDCLPSNRPLDDNINTDFGTEMQNSASRYEVISMHSHVNDLDLLISIVITVIV